MENFLSNNRDTVGTVPRWEYLLSLLAAYLFLLSWNGYIYGHGDMIELLPYAKWLTDSTLYPKDFFIQHISSQSINERYILAYFFSLFGKWMPQVALLLHFSWWFIFIGRIISCGKNIYSLARINMVCDFDSFCSYDELEFGRE